MFTDSIINDVRLSWLASRRVEALTDHLSGGSKVPRNEIAFMLSRSCVEIIITYCIFLNMSTFLISSHHLLYWCVLVQVKYVIKIWSIYNYILAYIQEIKCQWIQKATVLYLSRNASKRRILQKREDPCKTNICTISDIYINSSLISPKTRLVLKIVALIT